MPVCHTVATCLGMSQPVTTGPEQAGPLGRAGRLGAGRIGAEWITEPGVAAQKTAGVFDQHSTQIYTKLDSLYTSTASQLMYKLNVGTIPAFA